jgi:diacylglycerol kinase family enzyme
LLAAAACVLVVVIGGRRSIGVLLTGLIALAVTLAGAWWYLSNRGWRHRLGAVVAIAAPLLLIALYISRGVLWAVLVAVALAATATITALFVLAESDIPAETAEVAAPRPARPFLIMNPRSGGGKVGRFGLVDKAHAVGAQVALLEPGANVDVVALAKAAVAEGADVLGVAGGDGTQALVAGIAAQNDLPFVVLSAGTRNHFALDLGLDRDRPDTGLEALDDGVELQIDLGRIGDRTFVNNASFGAYAEIVQSPAYRDDKRGTTLQMLPDLLSGTSGPRLVVTVDGEEMFSGPQAVLVSNNPYEFSDLAGLGHRPRLDGGSLGIIGVTIESAAHAAALVAGRHSSGVRRMTATEVVVDADVPEIPVGVDGEALMLPTPVRCTIQPHALRVWVPRNRPGVRPTVSLSPTLVFRRALR